MHQPPFRRLLPAILASAVIAGASVAAMPVTAAEPAPRTAAARALPELEADSLGGAHVAFPAAAHGAPLALVVGFDRRAAASTRQWSHALLARFESRATVYAVVVAAGVPFFVHGAVHGDVARSAPAAQPQHESNVLLTFDNRGWKDLVPAGRPEDPGIVIVDAAGAVVYAKREAFDDAAVAAAVRSLATR